MSRNTCQNCGAMVEAPIVMQEPPMPVDLGMSLDVRLSWEGVKR
jgi:hypothetical protein